MKVSVITATTGNPFLAECIQSVRSQTYKDVEHIVIVDGNSRWESADSILKAVEFPNGVNEHVCILPYPTGTDRYNGHRIYGACSYLANGDYFIFLDEDNALEPNHVESLVNLVKEDQLHWAYSLRKIIDKESNLVCLDDCESLGKWQSVLNDNFVDVNCFFISRPLAIQISPIWYRKAREPGVVEVDRALTSVLMHPSNKLKFDTNCDYTVKYRVGNTQLSVKAEFFTQGNIAMLNRHNGVLPWKK
jgi:glycosyltransferase involved in cell wall biosynthesis